MRYTGPDGQPVEVQNVWASTLEREMAKIREVVQTHPYVAMDTEFPGVGWSCNVTKIHHVTET